MIGLEQPAAAERYFDRIEAKTNLLESQPRIGVRRPHIRPSMRMLVEVPYLLLYSTHPDTDEGPVGAVEIIRVVDARRDLRGIFQLCTGRPLMDLVKQRLRDAETIHKSSHGSSMMSTKKLPAHEIGSGNIFADLGLPNAEEHQFKAALVVQLKRLIAERGLTQTAAAKLIELKQPDLSKLLCGQLRLVSVEKLMRMLTAFDHDVEIAQKPHCKRGQAGRITFIPAT